MTGGWVYTEWSLMGHFYYVMDKLNSSRKFLDFWENILKWPRVEQIGGQVLDWYLTNGGEGCIPYPAAKVKGKAGNKNK